MRDDASVRLYTSLLRIYPRRFRDEYGTDMALLFARQLRDGPAPRVWGRTLLDLTVTVPSCHLELLMSTPSTSAAPIAFAAASLALTAVAIAAGTVLGVIAVAVPLAVLTATLAVLTWRRSRPVVGSASLEVHWWKLLLGGAAVLTALVLGTTATGELSAGAWWPAMLLGLLSVVALVAGLLLGVARLAHHRSPGAAS